jgi:hypothetical protein
MTKDENFYLQDGAGSKTSGDQSKKGDENRVIMKTSMISRVI